MRTHDRSVTNPMEALFVLFMFVYAAMRKNRSYWRHLFFTCGTFSTFEDVKVNLCMKSQNFLAAKCKGFTVFRRCSEMYDKRGFIVHGCVVQRNYNGRYHWCTSCLIRSWESLRSWMLKMRLTMLVHSSRSLIDFILLIYVASSFVNTAFQKKCWFVWEDVWNDLWSCDVLGGTQLKATLCSLSFDCWGTAVAAPPPFRPSDLALCRSHPIVTPYYCRLGDLLCFVFIVWFLCVLYVPSVLWYCWLGLLTCKNRLPYNLYCVGRGVKHCSIQSKSFDCFFCSVYPEQRRYRALHSIVLVSRSLT